MQVTHSVKYLHAGSLGEVTPEKATYIDGKTKGKRRGMRMMNLEVTMMLTGLGPRTIITRLVVVALRTINTRPKERDLMPL